MPYTTAGKNTKIDAWRLAYPYAALHSGVPSLANEISGGSPAYARQAADLGAASGGASAHTAPVVFDVPAGASVSYVGYWSAASGGTCGAYDDVPTETFAGQGTYTLTAQSVDDNAA